MASVMDGYDEQQQSGLSPLAAVFSRTNALKKHLKDVAQNPLQALQMIASRQDEDRKADDQLPEDQRLNKQIEQGLNWAGGGLGIIKKAGGNWLKNEVQNATSSIRHDIPALPRYQHVNDQGMAVAAEHGRPMTDAEWTASLNDFNQGIAVPQTINTFIDKKLNPYIQNLMATEKDPLRLMADAWPEQKALLQQQAQKRLDDLAAQRAKLVAEREVPPEYLTKLRERELKAEYEKRVIDEQNALHKHDTPFVRPPDVVPESVRDKRFVANNTEMKFEDTVHPYPYEGVAKSPEAVGWENMADDSIGITPAGEYQDIWKNKKSPQTTQTDNPWVDKLPEQTPTYHIAQGDGAVQELGFSHMLDEAYNALDHQSGLPKHLLLTQEQFGSMGVPQLSSHVAKIDAHRAALKAEENLAKANNPATHTVREYAESPQKLSWKEIKPGAPQGGIPEGAEVVETSPGTWKYKLKDVDAHGSLHTSPPYSSEAEALASLQSSQYFQAQSVREALKYEGDHLSHCVGGENYVNKVVNGEGQIFTLRNGNGVPQATIETSAPKTRAQVVNKDHGLQQIRNSLSPADKKELYNFDGSADEWLAQKYGPETQIDESHTVHPFWNEIISPAKIIQIKGKGNGRPPEEVQHAITDFIQNPPHGQPWAEVGDLNHTNLHEVGNTGVFTKEQIMEAMDKLPHDGRPVAERFESIKRHPSTMRGTLGSQIERVINGGNIDDILREYN